MFDLNILCVGQKTSTTNIPKNINIWINNTNTDYKKRKKHYYQIAPIMNYIDGIWYELLCSKDEISGTNICSYTANNGTYPYWISSEEVKNDLRTLVIDEEYLDSFKEILRFLLEKSPINTIFLFCRFQSNEAEIMCGTLSLDDFIYLLSQDKILTNICYSISNRHINGILCEN